MCNVYDDIIGFDAHLCLLHAWPITFSIKRLCGLHVTSYNIYEQINLFKRHSMYFAMDVFALAWMAGSFVLCLFVYACVRHVFTIREAILRIMTACTMGWHC